MTLTVDWERMSLCPLNTFSPRDGLWWGQALMKIHQSGYCGDSKRACERHSVIFPRSQVILSLRKNWGQPSTWWFVGCQGHRLLGTLVLWLFSLKSCVNVCFLLSCQEVFLSKGLSPLTRRVHCRVLWGLSEQVKNGTLQLTSVVMKSPVTNRFLSCSISGYLLCVWILLSGI